MRRRQIIFALVGLTLFLAVYVSVFSYWWLGSPTTIEFGHGRKIRKVEFHHNRVSWRTYSLWIPAFWFMENVCGYGLGYYVPADEHSIEAYGKFID